MTATPAQFTTYFRMLAISLTVLILAFALTNALVDPFGAHPAIGLRRLEPYRDHARTRIAKAEMVARGECEVLILGSSRAEAGFSPVHPAFGTTRVYNLGLGGTNLRETRLAFDYIRRHNHLRRVVLSVDFLMFTAVRELNRYFDASRFNPQLDLTEYHMKNLLGWQVTTATFGLLDDVRTGRRQLPPGHGFAIKTVPPGKSQRSLFEKRIVSWLEDPSTFASFRYSPDRLADFRHIVRACRRDNIALLVVIPPVHALDLETVRVAGLWSTFEQWKADLVRLVDEESVTGIVPLWDFTGYQGYVAEPIPAASDTQTRMRWYFENSHFTPALGELALWRMLDGALPHPTIDSTFGVKLTPVNIQAELARTRADREAYVRIHPDEIAWIESLAARVRSELAARPTE